MKFLSLISNIRFKMISRKFKNIFSLFFGLVIQKFGRHIDKLIGGHVDMQWKAASTSQWLKQNPTPVGFEPTRGDPIGLAGRRLNRSAKVSSLHEKMRHLLDMHRLMMFTPRIHTYSNCIEIIGPLCRKFVYNIPYISKRLWLSGCASDCKAHVAGSSPGG